MKLIYKLLDRTDDQCAVSVIEKELPELTAGEIVIQVKSCRTLDLRNEIIKELFLKCPRPIIPAAAEVAGVVCQVGEKVTTLHIGDRVVGLLPLTSEWSGCAEYCVMGEYDVVKLPDSVDMTMACNCVLDGVHAYTALQYMGRLETRDVVLVLDGATPRGLITVQLAVLWGAKVITTVSTPDEKSDLQKLKACPDVILVGDMSILVNQVIEETGGLGVDIVIDNGVQLFSREENSAHSKKSVCPSKHDVISLMAVGARWITSSPHFQLDPPDSDQLLLRSGSIHFLLPQTWVLCPSKQGKLQHILQNFFLKLDQQELEIKAPEVLSFHKLLDNEQSEFSGTPVVVEM